MAYTTINKGSSYFDTSLWTGTGAIQSITSLNFQPDWLWVKSRSTASNHRSQNSVTGVTKGMNPNQTSAEDTLTDCVTSFNSNGFTLGADSQGYVNTSSRTYVGWSWLASNTTVSNTSGSITSTVSVNTTAGFSIVSFTATSGVSSIGHGLGVAPKMIILKTRNQVAGWITGLSVNGWDKYLTLNSVSGNTTDDRMFSPSAGTDPTSTLFWSDQAAIGSAGTMIAYCFTDIKGYSKFGSYTGNGSTEGTFIYTGFKPAFVVIKNTSQNNDWIMFDSVRNTYNATNLYLLPSQNDAEASGIGDGLDFLSNGFKIRSTNSTVNNSGNTYIYMSFASNPFVTSGGIPVTAR